MTAENTATPNAPPWMAVGLVALGVLCLQIALTRVFSLLIWYHFAFLAIALALLGFTAGGLISWLHPPLHQGDLHGRMAVLAYGFGGSTAFALFVACHLPFAGSVLADPFQFVSFLLLVALVFVPFLLAGTVVSAVLTAYRAAAPGLYFADLAGSAAGCAVVIWSLDHLGGGAGGVLVAALAGTLGGLLFARRAGVLHRRRLFAGGSVLAVVLGGMCLLARDPLHGPFYLPNAKVFPRLPRELLLDRRCTSVACVDIFPDLGHAGAWGLQPGYRGPIPDQVGYSIDAWALTSTYRADRRPDGTTEYRHPVFEALPASLVHQVNRALRHTARRMLVLGAGGGVDVRAGLHFGVRQIEAVDINPTIVSAVTHEFNDFSGGLYTNPRVRVSVAEGRSYLRRSPNRYDVIQVSGVDTYAASQAGAFALSENYLYTVEAFGDYVSKLSDHGVLTFTRWLYRPERQTVRLCVIADTAFRRMGLGDGGQHVIVVAVPTPYADLAFSVLLFNRSPFTPDEQRVVRSLAESQGYTVLWSPDHRSAQNPIRDYFESPDRGAYVRRYPYRIEANTDDEPFFFEHNRFSRLFQSREAIFGMASGQMLLVVTLLLVLASAVGLLGLPLVLARRRGIPAGPPLGPGWTTYFLALGLGYIAVETVFVPRFVLYLGNPVHALSVVLFALLLSSGIGSAVSPRVVGPTGRRLPWVALSVASVLVVYQYGLQTVFQSTLRLQFPARVAVAAALVAVPGFLMGMPFPSGLARAPVDKGTTDNGGATWVARAWVLNGWASVLGTVGAMILAIAQGFSAVLAVAAGCYVLAALVAWLAGRQQLPEGPTAVEGSP